MRILESPPLFSLINGYLVDSPQPLKLSLLWNFGSLLAFCPVIQIVTGVTLVMHYSPSVLEAFNSVEHIMRDVNNGLLIRYLHSNIFFLYYFIIECQLYLCSAIFITNLIWFLGNFVFISNDVDKYDEELPELEKEYSELEGELEDLKESIVEDEFVSDDEEESTELSKTLKECTSEKDEFIGRLSEMRDKSLYDNDNARRDKSLLLDQLHGSLIRDLNAIDNLKSNIPIEDDLYDEIIKLEDKYNELSAKVSVNRDEYQSANLPPIPSGSNTDLPVPVITKPDFTPSDKVVSESASPKADTTKSIVPAPFLEPNVSVSPVKYFPQDSSDVMPDYTEMPDYNDDI